MSKYIDRQALLDAIPPTKEDKQISLYGAVADFISLVCDVPAADVVPVVHGHWTLERDPDDGNKPVCYHCSVCDSDGCHTSIRIAYKYCPNCGAKMDGGGANGEDH